MKPDFFLFLPSYKKQFVLSDLMSGLLVAIIALPLSIALGIQSVPESVSGNGIQMGIITAIIAGFMISFFGGSRFQIGGPTAAFVVILYSYLANPEIGLLGLQFATILAGVWLVVFAIVKAGNVMKFIPYPIVIGFTTGIGLTLIVGQIKDLFGLSGSGSELIEKLISYGEHITEFNYITFLIGALGIAIIIVLNKVNKKIPAAIIALIVCTSINLIISATAGDVGVKTIGSKYGEITASFYPISFAGISNVNFGKIIIPSFAIAFLCSIESLLSATVADGMAKTKHNPNQELLGQGLANIGSALLGGLPATGAIARTSANIGAGAKSSLSGMLHAVFLLIMYFSLMGVLKYIPLTVFSAILIVVAINMCNFPLFFKLIRFSIRDGIVVVATCLLTLFIDLIYGVLGGMVLTVLLDIPMYRTKLEITKEIISDGETLISVKGHLYIFNIDKVTKLLTQNGSPKTTLDFSHIESIDASAVERINKTIKACKHQGNEVVIVGASAVEGINKTIKSCEHQGNEVVIIGASEKVEKRLEQLKGVSH